jgi:hypothetical protein
VRVGGVYPAQQTAGALVREAQSSVAGTQTTRAVRDDKILMAVFVEISGRHG